MKNLFKILMTIVICFLFVGCTKPTEETKNPKPKSFEGYTKLEESNISSNTIDTKVLVRFGDTLYGKSFVLTNYQKGQQSLGKIEELTDEIYIPKLNNETNSKDLVNALIYNDTHNTIVLEYNNMFVMFEKIEEK